jgi:hypothetical protein
MLKTVAITNEKDIMAIYNVVSDELREQIKDAYPALFKPKQFDFSDFYSGHPGMELPFFVGIGLCDREEDVNKSLIVHRNYEVELDYTESNYQIIRFFKKY